MKVIKSFRVDFYDFDPSVPNLTPDGIRLGESVAAAFVDAFDGAGAVARAALLVKPFTSGTQAAVPQELQ